MLVNHLLPQVRQLLDQGGLGVFEAPKLILAASPVVADLEPILSSLAVLVVQVPRRAAEAAGIHFWAVVVRRALESLPEQMVWQEVFMVGAEAEVGESALVRRVVREQTGLSLWSCTRDHGRR
jgi:hypothetical protein